MALSTPDLQAIRSFSRMPEYRRWLAVIQNRLTEVDAKLRTASGEELFRLQGRAQQLAELLGEAEAAGRALDKPVVTRLMKTNPIHG